MGRFDSTAIPHGISDNANKDNDVSSASDHSRVNEQPHLDVAGDLPDTLNYPELQDAEVVDESDEAHESLNCTMFRSEDSYFHIHPGTKLEPTT